MSKPARARPSVFDGIALEVGAAATDATVTETATPAKNESDMFRTSLYLSRAVHDKLREIAFHERKKVHELFIEGLDKVLTERGYAVTSELRQSAKAS